MACDCLTYVCLNAKFNPCSEGVQLALTATETTDWTGEIEFNGMWREFAFGVVEGEDIVIPTSVLNEYYNHRTKFYNNSGDLVNDVCYTLKARAMADAGVFAVIPADALAALTQRVDGIEELVEDMIFTVTVPEDGTTIVDNRMAGRVVAEMSTQNQTYTPDMFTKTLPSNTLIYPNGFFAGQVVTITLEY